MEVVNINIRHGVFETNSSSSHSISVSKEGSASLSNRNLQPNGSDIIYRKVSDLAYIYGVDKSEIWEYFNECLGIAEEDVENIVLLDGGEYGWGYDVLSTPIEKLNYIYTYIITTTTEQFLCEDERYIRLKEIVDNMAGLEIFPDYFRFLFESGYDAESTFFEEQIRYFMDYGNLDNFEAIRELSEDETIEMDEVYTLSSDIYIDHQSMDLLDEYFEDDNNEPLKELIFNDNYKIIIDNDNG